MVLRSGSGCGGYGGGFRPLQSIFAGMTQAQLQAALTAAQTAYIALMSGGKAVRVSYTEGESAKSVDFTPAEGPGLANLISELQAMLGIKREPRRPVRFSF